MKICLYTYTFYKSKKCCFYIWWRNIMISILYLYYDLQLNYTSTEILHFGIKTKAVEKFEVEVLTSTSWYDHMRYDQLQLPYSIHFEVLSKNFK